MTALLLLSAGLRFAAVALTIRLLVRLRDWRIAFLAVMLLLMAVRAVLFLITYSDEVLSQTQPLAELPGLAVSIMAVLGVVFAERSFRERTETIEALQSATSRYRGLVEDQVDMVCRFKPDCTLTYVNRSYADCFDRTPEELVGTRFLDLVPAYEHRRIGEYLGRFTRDAPVARIVHEVRLPSGESRWHEWTEWVGYPSFSPSAATYRSESGRKTRSGTARS